MDSFKQKSLTMNDTSFTVVILINWRNDFLSARFLTRAIVICPINLFSDSNISFKQLSTNDCKGTSESFTHMILTNFWEKTPTSFKVNSNGGCVMEDNLFFASFIASSSITPKNFRVRCKFSLEVNLPVKLGSSFFVFFEFL